MPPSRPVAEIAVAISSDHPLVAETVRGALHGDGITARSVAWPDDSSLVPSGSSDDIGVILADLVTVECVDAARSMVSCNATRWLVLTSAPRGPLWGAVLEAGAWSVMTSAIGVQPLRRTIGRIAEGELRMKGTSAHRLKQSWRQLDAERDSLIARFDRLSPREREILVLLRAGDSVTAIADLLGTADTTVRSQVKSVFRKLGVGSQLAAVAACTMLQDLGCDPLSVGRDDRRLLSS